MGKLVLATSLITSYGYLSEQTITYYGGDVFDSHVYWYRLTDFSKYAWIVWFLFTCNTIVPQLLWFRKLRRNQVVLAAVSLLVLVGMWFERYMIITSSLSEDFLPSAYGFFKPTVWDILTYAGSIGFFFVPFLLFVRYFPVMSISETQGAAAGLAWTGGGTMTSEFEVHGLMAQFLTPEAMLAATRQAREAGYREMDAYTPYTVEGLATELGMRRSRMPSIVLIGGLVGAGAAFFMQYYSMAINYPFNSGGRPHNSWPVFIPVTFEVTVLIASLAAFLGMILLNALPHPNHPVFNVPEFARASRDRFFLCIEVGDPKFDMKTTSQFLAGLNPHGDVIVVPIAPEAVEEAESEQGPEKVEPTVEVTSEPS